MEQEEGRKGELGLVCIIKSCLKNKKEIEMYNLHVKSIYYETVKGAPCSSSLIQHVFSTFLTESFYLEPDVILFCLS